MIESNWLGLCFYFYFLIGQDFCFNKLGVIAFFFFLIGIFLIRTYESIYINCIFYPSTFLLNQMKEFFISLLCHLPTKYHERKLKSILSSYFFSPTLFSIFSLFDSPHQTKWEYLKVWSYKNRIGIGKLRLEMPHKKA